MQKITKLARSVPHILQICSFDTLWSLAIMHTKNLPLLCSFHRNVTICYNENNSPTHCSDICNFSVFLGMLERPAWARKIWQLMQLWWNFIYMHKIKAVAQPIPKIMNISFSNTLWACSDMPGHAHLKYGN